MRRFLVIAAVLIFGLLVLRAGYVWGYIDGYDMAEKVQGVGYAPATPAYQWGQSPVNRYKVGVVENIAPAEPGFPGEPGLIDAAGESRPGTIDEPISAGIPAPTDGFQTGVADFTVTP